MNSNHVSYQRIRIIIGGYVQGVGFRPHIYKVAKKLNLTGWVLNNPQGVVIEAQGSAIKDFISEISIELPPLANIDVMQTFSVPYLSDETDFHIVESELGLSTTKILPDVAICNACLHEMFEPQSRFYYYPFLNCTHCGPRLTIIRNLPYDRPNTSMAPFLMCSQCQDDYSNPENRRYHAQSTECANCGPLLSSPIEEIVHAISDGKIVAVKGLGGYQLICDARNELTVLKLRERKQRNAKPFAVMVLNFKSAHKIAHINDKESELLTSIMRPIVLLTKFDNVLPDIIAPGLSHLGIMLPCTPLHYLILHGLADYPQNRTWFENFSNTVLVVTSANPCGNPLLTDDTFARQELAMIADKIVSYNREIVTRVDDSVMRVINNKFCFIRRARGYVPTSIKLPRPIPSILAVGGYLKNTFCITRGDEAFVSQYIGDLKNAATINFFHESLAYMLKYLNAKPECVAHDLHPDFYTTHFANQFADENAIARIFVQHHHAHLAAVAAEHSIEEPALGLALDGYGYGENGGAWGGELFLYQNNHYQHLSRLHPLQQPGGDIAVHQPWRMAASVLFQLGYHNQIVERFAKQPGSNLLPKILMENINTPLTSSCGRLFDAVSALLGVCLESQYESQAAMLLESLVTNPEVLSNGWEITADHLSLLPTLQQLLNLDAQSGANIFHGTLAAALAEWLYHYSQQLNIKVVLFSGGCFINQVLLQCLINHCQQYGLIPYFPTQLPANDGGISLGQAWVAGNKTGPLYVKENQHVLSDARTNYSPTR